MPLKANPGLPSGLWAAATMDTMRPATSSRDTTWTWLRPLLLAAGAGFSIVGLWLFFVRTTHGQLLDTLAYQGAKIGSHYVVDPLNWMLLKVSVPAIALAMVVVAVTALLRRRWLLAFEAATVVAGANVSTRVLKYHVFYRPDLLPEARHLGMLNSLPSGHTTAAASAVVAAVLVAPPRLRVLVAYLGTIAMVLFGWGTVTTQWHRPSDAIAAILVCFCWAFAALAVQAFRFQHLGRSEAERPRSRPSRLWPALLLVAGLAALAIAGYGLLQAWDVTDPAATRSVLFAAYASSACGIVGTAACCMAALLRLTQLLDARKG